MASLIDGLGGQAGFGETTMAPDDDSFTNLIDLTSVFPGGINFFGEIYTAFYVNMNGSITFSGGLTSYRPEAISGSTNMPIIAPFWADIDTRGPTGNVSSGGTSTGSNRVHIDLDPSAGRIIITWDDVGYFNGHSDRVNAFQLVLTSLGNGDFSIEFRYESIDWSGADVADTATYSPEARAGFSAGDGINYFELPQSGNSAALLGLESSSNVGEAGVWRFNVRDGYPGAPIRVSDGEATEGQGGDRNTIQFVVTLDRPAQDKITVDYRTVNGTAEGGSAWPFDYVSQTGTITFSPGQTQQIVTVEIVGDDRGEPDETILLELFNANNGIIVDGTAVGTIHDDDGIYLEAATGFESLQDGSTFVTVNVRLPRASDQVVEVRYGTRDRSATDQLDYYGPVGTLVFQPGEISQRVTIEIIADDLVEGEEFFTFFIADAVNTSIAVSEVQVRLMDGDDPNPVVPETPPPTSSVPAEYGLQTVGDDSDPLRAQYQTPRYHFDELTSRWGIPGVVDEISAFGSSTREFANQTGKMVVDSFVKTVIQGFAVPKLRALADTINRVNGTLDYLKDWTNNIFKHLDTIDVLKNGGSKEEMDAFEDDLEKSVQISRDKAATTLGDEFLAPVSESVRVRVSNSDPSLIVDVDFGDDKAILFADAGHYDQFFGSFGRDVVYLADKNDFAWGGGGDDSLYGGTGRDYLYGSWGQDELFGGTGNDILDGGLGADLLDGGGGADEMYGEQGSDVYVVNDEGDRVVERHAKGGIDTVLSSVSFLLGAHVENLTLTGSAAITGTGNALANVLTGNAAANTLIGGAGNDILDGGAGADTLKGGAGNDVYFVDKASDIVFEKVDEGNDKVIASVSFALGANVESIVLAGTRAIDATGSALGNTLEGNNAANRLDGGEGADKLIGHGGNDFYIVDATGDKVIERVGEGHDTVLASASHALADNVEDLQLSGAAVTARGNGQDNRLTGSNSANKLYGMDGADILDGGAGADRMYGGAGDDVYYVDDAGDQTIEEDLIAGGDDRVVSSISYVLSAGIETLFLTGIANIDATGNDLANLLKGNAGSNVLNGGAGADDMRGARGNDTYFVDNAGDTVSEGDPNGGTDHVFSSVTFFLGDNVENLSLTGLANLNGVGNAGRNVLRGNDGSNRLNGGEGADKLIGGLGNDTYIVDNVGDLVVEDDPDGGQDTVRSSVSYRLTGNVENLILTGNAAIDATGNSLRNSITGNGAANLIDGNGGADTMAGGKGDDAYLVDHSGDVVIEHGGEGYDTVLASVSTVLASNVEALTLTGRVALNGTGNDANNVLRGNDRANRLNGAAGDDKLVGGLGDDTYVVDSTSDVIIEKAGEGYDTVLASSTFKLTGNIEAILLTGKRSNDAFGNSLDNVLTGNLGANLLDGKTGADTMRGGAGNDTYVVDNRADAVIENSGEGIDRVKSSISYALGNNIEELELIGQDAIDGTGNALDNLLIGNGKANRLDGGMGADRMVGGDGDDFYIVDNIRDEAYEAFGATGYDTVLSSVSYQLGKRIEALVLTGASSIDALGNSLDNRLKGNSGNNLLNGLGGSDLMYGLGGDDTYVVDDAGDVVIESGSGGGYDTVRSSITYTLGDYVEALILTGALDISGTGNGLANNIVGNVGDNRLDGAYGADVMQGGLGDDVYFVDDIGDTVNENSGEGFDTVKSNVDYQLRANLEQLILVGTAAINGTGNGAANTLVGNSADNVLEGRGGKDKLDGKAGADTLIGGTGSDIYVVDNPGDIVIEDFDEGTDTVRSSISFTLSDNVENLILTGTDAISGTGNAWENRLTGNAAANTLSGLDGYDWLDGGAGADTLVGGNGNDTYIVDNAGDLTVEEASGGVDQVFASVSWTLSANVENLTLAEGGAWSATGNALGNVIIGNSSSNVIDGRAGADTMRGGAGNDIYYVDDMNDQVVEFVGEGHDLIYASVSYSASYEVEDIVLVGSALQANGNPLANSITGNDLANILAGYDGDDLIDGRGGADTMYGGFGNDIFMTDGLDTLIEDADQGYDTVRSTVSYTLDNNFEALELQGSAISGTGNSLDNQITGNYGNNILSGGAGDDVLNGLYGSNRLIGGQGDDLYYVRNAGDTVEELAGEGIDTINTSLALTIMAANVENLVIYYYAEVDPTTNMSTAVGNALNNEITGNDQNNRIDGAAGADVMVGGLGEDYYIVDNSGDYIYEGFFEGTDTVESSISYTLGMGLENLILTGAAYSGIGNSEGNVIIGTTGANYLVGNAGNDTLDGLGGADTLEGGAGDDTYVIYQGAVFTIIETELGGNDTIVASFNMSLTSIENVENLTLVGEASSAYGNEKSNVLRGSDLSNVLNGLGGDDIVIGGGGIDQLFGGDGADRFVFEALEDSQGVGDIIMDFSRSDGDIIVLNYIDANALYSGDQQFSFIGNAVFNGTAGQLRYYFDGSGGTTIEGDVNGDGVADLTIRLIDQVDLTVTDFVL